MSAVQQRDPTSCELGLCLKVFPTARHNQDIDAAVWEALSARGWDARNTLFAHSTCPDEVNYDCMDSALVNLMHRRWGEKFTLGGLAGMPFCGRTGWAAFSSHTPHHGGVKGNVLILFAPHTGIGADGTIGRLQRKGQKTESTCCGAAVAASNSTEPPEQIHEYDLQQSVLTAHVHVHKKSIEEHPSGNRALGLVYTNYEIVRQYLRNILQDPEKHCSEIAIVGGIMVNLPEGIDDRFVPLDFEVLSTGTGRVETYSAKFRADMAGSAGWRAPKYEPFFESELRSSISLRRSLAPPSTEHSRRPPQEPKGSPEQEVGPIMLVNDRVSDPFAKLRTPQPPLPLDAPPAAAAKMHASASLSTDMSARTVAQEPRRPAGPPHGVTIASTKAEDQTGRTLFVVRFERGGERHVVEHPYTAFAALRAVLKARGVRAAFPGKTLLKCSGPALDVRRRQLAAWLSEVVRTCWPDFALAGFLNVNMASA